MSKEHTKGPWRVEEGTTLIWGACDPEDLSDRGMGYPITECKTSAGYSLWAKGPSADEGEANARLIAAAPDLLEALEGAILTLEQVCEGQHEDNVCCHHLRAARAAIDKARGEKT